VPADGRGRHPEKRSWGLVLNGVLIPGGTGFTGRPLAEWPRQDAHDVVVLSHDAAEPHVIDCRSSCFDAITQALTESQPGEANRLLHPYLTSSLKRPNNRH
jgi:hypothetical protein